MANRLAESTSPYLLQHKDNPVAWWPWGQEAFDEARRRDVPLFVSIGYATCHWCHVMAHESFEDPDVADALGRFVAVKVDREELPDVDELYMTACQMFTGRGGWPLTVFLDHDLRPFFAGTYFPKRTRGPMVGLIEVLDQVDHAWKHRREDLLHQAGHILDRLHVRPAPGEPSDASLAAAAKQILDRRDPQHGGPAGAPKFPSCHNLLFLLRQHARHQAGAATAGGAAQEERDELRDAGVDAVLAQLRGMLRGGIHDHVGGGFHRYSTDEAWLLPHFEKMLYDQAMAAMAGTEAWQATGDPDAEAVARSALDWILEGLRDPGGAFWSAQDADSEGEEGTYYVWRRDEIMDALQSAGLKGSAPLFLDAYGVREEGNFLDEATRQRTGTNVLHRAMDDAAVARRHDVPVAEVPRILAAGRTALAATRRTRVAPSIDDKVLADWNGLAVAALSKAGVAFGDGSYIEAASEAAAFLRTTMWQDGRMLHSHRAGVTRRESYLSDHAYALWGAIELYQATFEPDVLAWAQELAAGLDRFCEGDAWALSEEGVAGVRRVEGYDGALPSASGVAAWSLARLSDLDGNTQWVDRAWAVVRAFGGDAVRHPGAFVGLHLAVDWLLGPTTQALAVGSQFVAPLRRGYRPHRVVLLARGGLADVAPWTADMHREGAYLCEGHTCRTPITDIAAIA